MKYQVNAMKSSYKIDYVIFLCFHITKAIFGCVIFHDFLRTSSKGAQVYRMERITTDSCTAIARIRKRSEPNIAFLTFKVSPQIGKDIMYEGNKP